MKLVDEDAEVVGVVHRRRDKMDAAGLERLVQDRDELLGGVDPNLSTACFQRIIP